MAKKSQALIIILWILVILTVLAVSIGHRVSLALRLSRYQKDRIKAHYLAKAGMNRAIVEIDKDINDFDTFDESWADNERVFQKITFNDSLNDFATVRYVINEDDKEETKFGVIDEERKININTASRQLLLALLEECGITDAQTIADNICAWRGDQDPLIPEESKNYESLGYPCKAEKFSNIAEINLVKGVALEDYQKIKELITIYGDGLININTASPLILTIFTRGIAKSSLIDESFADSLAKKIIDYRNTNGPFKAMGDMDSIPYTGAEEQNILNNLKSGVALKSVNFLIEVTGNVSKIKSRVAAVYNRSDKTIIYWHES
jgi:general secretion pathway protein K